MMNRIKTGLAALLVLLALSGCAALSSIGAASTGSSTAPTCLQISDNPKPTGGVIPDFMGNTTPLAKFDTWLKANPPCIPASWVPDGCSLTASNQAISAFPGGRYPWLYWESYGPFWPADLHNLTSSLGVQVLGCAHGYLVLYWDEVSYHEVSSIVTDWSPWDENGHRHGLVPVGSHDPVFPNFFHVWIDEWQIDAGVVQLADVLLSQNGGM
jgi:hypothetical protein